MATQKVLEELSWQVTLLQSFPIETVPPYIKALLDLERKDVMASRDNEYVTDYLATATDLECYCFLIEIMSHAFLSDDFSDLLLFLGNRLFPQQYSDKVLLTENLVRLLDELRGEIRRIQLVSESSPGCIPNGLLQ